MSFPTATFAAFLVVALCATWAVARWPRVRSFVLVALGAAFYGYWDEHFVALLGAVAFGTWAVAAVVARLHGRARVALTTAGVVALLATLAWFKYYGFFVDSVTSGLARLGLDVHPPLLQVALPLGISFWVFQAVSYLVDVHRGRYAAAPLLDVLAWLTFFPTVMSGPITRADELMPQFAARPSGVDLGEAYLLIGRGLVKKLVVASFIATAITDDVFAAPGAYGAGVLLVAVYAYAAQIYADFSGYTDMARGIALLLGFRLPENFNRPYTATSVQDFWSRWHMTLSRWLRDYLFAPITGRRATSPVRVYGGIVVVMLLAGLWHGAAWTFVAFGAVHGVAMASERWRRVRRRARGLPPPAATPVRQALRRVATFHVVCLGWVFFAAGSVGDALDVLRGIATRWPAPVEALSPLLFATVLGVVLLQYVRVPRLREPPPAAAYAALFALALVPILALAPTTVPAFIYFRF